jgi:hypothetical protein
MTRGTILALLVAVALTACGRKDESLAKSAGSKVGEALTNFGSGVGAGIDAARSVPVELTSELAERGLTRTVSKWEKGGLCVYVIARDTVASKVMAKALNKDGDEIGRSKIELALDADDAKYVTFTFPPEMDAQLVTRYVISAAR